MKKSLLISICLLMGISLSAQQKETSRNRYALVIGNQRYKDFPLKNTLNDAEMIARSLESKAFNVTFKKNLDSTELKPAINAYVEKVNAEPDSVSMVYITGHGFTSSDRNYFLPVDNDKFHSEEEAKKYAVDLEDDLAAKIKTTSQIYVVDGAYDNPFKVEGSRGISVKGGLSNIRNQRESVVGFLFSTTPGTVVVNQNESVSVFAKAVKEQIESSKANLDEVFASVKKNVASKTSGEQNPYSSATTLKFAFNGDELTALQKRAAVAKSDKVFQQQTEMSRTYREQVQKRVEALALAEEDALNFAKQISEEVRAKRKAQNEEDARRAKEEAEKAQQRSDEANGQIMALREEFENSAALLKDSMKKNASAEERVSYIEEMKSKLFNIRETAQLQITDFNSVTDKETELKADGVWSREYKTVELKNGEPTDAAIERRSKEIAEIKNEAALKKLDYQKQKNAQVEEDNKKWLPQISAAYSKLEGESYVITSLDEEMTVRVEDYDGSIGKWKLHVSADLFGKADLFSDDIFLGYSDVTGKKNTDITKMTDAQFKAYNEDVEIYDALFKSSTPVFYVKLSYRVYKWRYASEYHFVPMKCEIVRLGKKNKVITKIYEKDLTSSDFSVEPLVDIRTNEDRRKDNKKADKITEHEMKIHGVESQLTYYEKKVQEQKIREKSVKNSNKDYKKSNSEEKPKWGRNTFYIAGDFDWTNMFDSSYFKDSGMNFYKNPQTKGGSLNLTFNLGKVYYWGVGGGFQMWDYKNFKDSLSDPDVKSKMKQVVWFGRFTNGFGIPIGPYVRPYIEGGLGIYGNVYNARNYNVSDKKDESSLYPDFDSLFGFNAGGGIDIILFKNLLLTVGVDYNWLYFFKTLKNGSVVIDNEGYTSRKAAGIQALATPDFTSWRFSVGLGCTW